MDREEALTFTIEPSSKSSNNNSQVQALTNFINSHPPSLTSSSRGPWIWIRRDWKDTSPPSTTQDHTAAEQAAIQVLDEVQIAVAQIECNPDIPTRASKKKPTSKKAEREKVFAEAKEELERVARRHNHTCGKLLFFLSPEAVDGVWKTVATSLLNGPLSKTVVHTMKVSTSDGGSSGYGGGTGGNNNHVMCLYFPDIFSKEAAKEVLQALLTAHGLTPSPAKPDLYTAIGLDAKHPSKLPASVWKSSDFFTAEEIKRMKEERSKSNAAEFSKKNEAASAKRKGQDSDSDDSDDDFAPTVAKRAKVLQDGIAESKAAQIQEEKKLPAVGEGSKATIEKELAKEKEKKVLSKKEESESETESDDDDDAFIPQLSHTKAKNSAEKPVITGRKVTANFPPLDMAKDDDGETTTSEISEDEKEKEPIEKNELATSPDNKYQGDDDCEDDEDDDEL